MSSTPQYTIENGVVRSTNIKPIRESLLGDYLEELWVGNADQVAFINASTGEQITFGRLLSIVKRIAAFLQQKHDVRANDIVVFTAKSNVRSCCIFLALVFCQATIVSPKHSYTAYEYGALLKDVQTSLAIGDAASAPKLRSAKQRYDEADGLPLRDVLDLDDNVFWNCCLNVDDGSFCRPPASDPKATILFMTFTSGSTGTSKAVCVSHYNTIASIAQVTVNSSTALMCNPLSHISGILSLIVFTVQARTVVVSSEDVRNDIDQFAEFCETHAIQSFAAMPVLFNKLVDKAPMISKRLSGVRYVLTGGSVVSQTLVDQFHATYPHITLEQLYGLSESSGIVLISRNVAEFNSLEVAPNVEAKIVDVVTRKTLAPNETGELFLRTPTVAMGYYNRPEATAETFLADGWLATGDLARMDDKGRFTIVDRVKQMIKCLDAQVAPGDLEDLLVRDKCVSQAVVAGIPHRHFGEAPAAFIVPKDNTVSNTLAELRKRLLAEVDTKCAYTKRLHGGLFFVKEIPSTESGKFSRKDLLAEHKKRTLEYLD